MNAYAVLRIEKDRRENWTVGGVFSTEDKAVKWINNNYSQDCVHEIYRYELDNGETQWIKKY